jgi:hypothetical protein
MTEWLRRRPNQPDSADEFLRDFAEWSRALVNQEGFNYGEMAWFLKRARMLTGPTGTLQERFDNVIAQLTAVLSDIETVMECSRRCGEEISGQPELLFAMGQLCALVRLHRPTTHR